MTAGPDVHRFEGRTRCAELHRPFTRKSRKVEGKRAQGLESVRTTCKSPFARGKHQGEPLPKPRECSPIRRIWKCCGGEVQVRKTDALRGVVPEF